MPIMKIDDFEMYYEIHGEENEIPLVLIAGLGFDISAWTPQIPELSKKYRVIAFDNRDVGRTSKTDTSYTIDTFAEDTYHLLNKLGVEKTHFLGISMGAAISQTFALKHPKMVRSLVLCAAYPRVSTGLGFRAVSKELIKIIPRELFIKYLFIWFFGFENRANEDFVKTTLEQFVNHPYLQPPEAFIRQCEALDTFNLIERLNEINAPTLVLAGDSDVLVLVMFSQYLASLIPNAEFKVLEGCGHFFNLEKPEEFNKAVLEFLEKH